MLEIIEAEKIYSGKQRKSVTSNSEHRALLMALYTEHPTSPYPKPPCMDQKTWNFWCAKDKLACVGSYGKRNKDGSLRVYTPNPCKDCWLEEQLEKRPKGKCNHNKDLLPKEEKLKKNRSFEDLISGRRARNATKKQRKGKKKD